jgi:predicted nucleic acid-binding protein
MTVFVDTSALYAVLDRDDANHAKAAGVWRRLVKDGAGLVTHNYVLVESYALAQRRLAAPALRVLTEDIIPLFRVEWISEGRHRRAVDMAVTAGRKKLSVVDCASFVVMREVGVRQAFCFDRHFREFGFEVVPGTPG